MGNGGASGNLPGASAIANNGTLAFNRSDQFTFGNLVTGTGGLSQIGAGTTILTANNSYAGPTSVTGGALYVNGTQTGAGPATVAMAPRWADRDGWAAMSRSSPAARWRPAVSARCRAR